MARYYRNLAGRSDSRLRGQTGPVLGMAGDPGAGAAVERRSGRGCHWRGWSRYHAGPETGGANLGSARPARYMPHLPRERGRPVEAGCSRELPRLLRTWLGENRCPACRRFNSPQQEPRFRCGGAAVTDPLTPNGPH